MRHNATTTRLEDQLIKGKCSCGWSGPAHGNSVAGRDTVRREIESHLNASRRTA